MSSATSEFCASRPHDFFYDPLYTVSTGKDLQKAATSALKRVSEVHLRPSFSCMFSELGHYPCVTAMLTTKNRLPNDMPRALATKSHEGYFHPASTREVVGVDRHKYFTSAMEMSEYALPALVAYAPSDEPLNIRREGREGRAPSTIESKKCSTQGTQTLLRDAETQTSPYSPPYYVPGGKGLSPAMVMATRFTWGKGLPAGNLQLERIKRARQMGQMVPDKPNRRASEPSSTSGRLSMGERHALAAVEREEFASRAQELNEIGEIRMELADQLLTNHEACLSQQRSERVARLKRAMEARQEKFFARMMVQYNRDTRKLARQLGPTSASAPPAVRPGPAPPTLATLHLNPGSELYAPNMRHGQHPARRSEKLRLSPSRGSHSQLDRGLEVLQLPLKTQQARSAEGISRLTAGAVPSKEAHKPPESQLVKKRRRGIDRMCCRETPWTHESLKELQTHLKNIRCGDL